MGIDNILNENVYLCTALEGVAEIVLQPSNRQQVCHYELDYLDFSRTL